jgi:predicted  nucleic acid-binding Zn-ribbon protein
MTTENLGNEPTGQNEPGGTAAAGGEPGGDNKPAGENGGPDAAKAAEKYRSQRDEQRKRADALEEQLKNLKAKGDIDQVMQQLEEQRSEAEEAAKKAEADRVNSVRLAQAGCVDLEVALSLLDENGDVDALKESKPYLFNAKPKTGSTGFKPDGAAEGASEKLAKARKLAGIRKK